VTIGLRRMSRPEMPAAVRNSLSSAVNHQRRKEEYAWPPFSGELLDRVRLGLAPYGIGVAASLLVGVAFMAMMFTRFEGDGAENAFGGQNGFLLANNASRNGEISPADYARARLDFASESPSINPKGALVAMTRSLMRGDMKDDEVVVVAEVFSTGLAQITEVVEPSRDRRAVGELEKALESDPAYAPFVPTTLEKRPESVRVVLKFQNVNVSTSTKRSRNRL
jgi:hypothetical protein